MPGNADCAYATRTWRSGRDIGTRFFRREATDSYVARREIRVMRTAFLMEISTTESVLINVFANNSHVRFELSGAVRNDGTRIVSASVQSGDVPRWSTRQQCDHQRY
jgi:hypothetical protein